MNFDFTRTIIDGIKIWVEKKISSNIHGLASEEYVNNSIEDLSTTISNKIDDTNNKIDDTNNKKADLNHSHIWDDINDRPFYSHGTDGRVVFSDEEFLAPNEYKNWNYANIDISTGGLLKHGKSYTITAGITTYGCVASYIHIESNHTLKRLLPDVWGDIEYCISLNPSLGYMHDCCVFYGYKKDNNGINNYVMTCFIQDGLHKGTYSISIIENIENVQHIENKYISDTIKLPEYTQDDEGKLLEIVAGAPTWVAIPNAEDGVF